MPSNFKICFFDIDWTLYDHKNHEWPDGVLSSLMALHEKGLKLILCSARPYHSMENFGVFSLGIPWDGYISSAGAVTVVGDECLRKTIMKKEDVIAFLEVVKKLNLTCELVEPLDRYLVYKQNRYSRAFYKAYNEVVPPLKGYENEEVVGLDFFAPKKFDEYIKSQFPQLLYFRYYKYAVDVMGEPHLKGDGIEVILEHYHLTKDEALGFGDDFQDMSMAEHLPHFVAMGQGRDELKKMSEYVTTPVWDKGLINALVHYGLL